MQGSQRLRASTHPTSSNPKSELLPHHAEGLVDDEKVVTTLRINLSGKGCASTTGLQT